MSPLFGAGACLRKISSSKLRLMRNTDRLLPIPTPDGHLPNPPPPFISLSEFVLRTPALRKNIYALARNCPPMRPGACAVPVPPPASRGAGACALPGMPMRPMYCCPLARTRKQHEHARAKHNCPQTSMRPDYIIIPSHNNYVQYATNRTPQSHPRPDQKTVIVIMPQSPVRSRRHPYRRIIRARAEHRSQNDCEFVHGWVSCHNNRLRRVTHPTSRIA
ncbi:MAG: hypothetical protein C5S49_04070 [Candidatus Methanogaster sp.]|nr:MAG: hypothetical protein C5S49_04070 [ANME-2 cluster archaeon]